MLHSKSNARERKHINVRQFVCSRGKQGSHMKMLQKLYLVIKQNHRNFEHNRGHITLQFAVSFYFCGNNFFQLAELTMRQNTSLRPLKDFPPPQGPLFRSQSLFLFGYKILRLKNVFHWDSTLTCLT